MSAISSKPQCNNPSYTAGCYFYSKPESKVFSGTPQYQTAFLSMLLLEKGQVQLVLKCYKESLAQRLIYSYKQAGTSFNTLRHEQNYRNPADNIFKCIFFNENDWNFTEISLKCVLDNIINLFVLFVSLLSHFWHSFFLTIHQYCLR